MSTEDPPSKAPTTKFPVKALIPLRAFPGHPAPDAKLTVSLEVNPQLETNIEFRWRSDTVIPLIPPLPGRTAERRDGLWERTCFEVFFRKRGESAYWEINVAPCGDWNVYSFTGCRQGMLPERRVAAIIGHRLKLSQDEVLCRFRLPLQELTLDPRELEFSATAVIAQECAPISYWAMKHAGLQPDFHHPDSFAFHFP